MIEHIKEYKGGYLFLFGLIVLFSVLIYFANVCGERRDKIMNKNVERIRNEGYNVQQSKTCHGLNEYELVQLGIQNTIDGSFFLGCGNINGELHYQFYIKNGNAIIPKQEIYLSVVIYYTDKSPRAFYENNGFLGKWHLFIPENSIKNYYKIDLGEK